LIEFFKTGHGIQVKCVLEEPSEYEKPEPVLEEPTKSWQLKRMFTKAALTTPSRSASGLPTCHGTTLDVDEA